MCGWMDGLYSRYGASVHTRAGELQKQEEEQLVPCGRGHCVLVSKRASKFHPALVFPIGADAFECKTCISLVSPYRAVDLGITLD